MGIGYWTSYVYCATCDKSVTPSATVCPHCGAVFGPSEDN